MKDSSRKDALEAAAATVSKTAGGGRELAKQLRAAKGVPRSAMLGSDGGLPSSRHVKKADGAGRLALKSRTRSCQLGKAGGCGGGGGKCKPCIRVHITQQRRLGDSLGQQPPQPAKNRKAARPPQPIRLSSRRLPPKSATMATPAGSDGQATEASHQKRGRHAQEKQASSPAVTAAGTGASVCQATSARSPSYFGAAQTHSTSATTGAKPAVQPSEQQQQQQQQQGRNSAKRSVDDMQSTEVRHGTINDTCRVLSKSKHPAPAP